MSLIVSDKSRVGICRSDHAEDPGLDRRRLLAMLGIGATSVVAGTVLPGWRAFAAPGTDALLLNCIDYRLTAATTQYMTKQGMAGKYDQFILAGAALGATPKNSR